MLNKSFDRINLLNKALDGAWLKNSAISNNIANVNTPGYKRQTVNFEEVLRTEIAKSSSAQMIKTNPKHMDHMGNGQISIEEQANTSYRVDDNNVDIDVENAEMAKNTLYYNAVINSVNGQYSRLKSVFNINK
ncbi:flagellar basal body rod protein FlgB [Fusibacter tunisiensis]|uniref:Flagellar basal body rod protein FlgB n=1 Tax=Fusibacter tunisiensis TaxID=1008308 RepID=A0ABS2MMF5_9FIRM|nr:flagellar basal body rod protein FlgB [Fusibacter tunisiensis]MBM7560577.1 flagellar basal-body rod protein FlgB [Fusibacter tunisiensis]